MHIESKNWFYILIITLCITDLAILLNIPFLRQILGFLFLTLLPGLLIIQILKLDKIDFLEKLILSWGLSIAFLMFFGLFVNNLSLSLGYETPLSTIPLLIFFNTAFIVLAVIGYKQSEKSIFPLPNFSLTPSEKAFLIVPIFFPALSIFGMRVMNTTDNNIILMFLLFSIPAYVAFVCFFNQKFPKKLYPIVIFLISISLLLLLPLRSNHLIGADVHAEYYLFHTTLDNLHWSIVEYSHLDACLAISLLPTIYQSILNIPTEFLYKILHSILCSVFPVIIYIISKKYVEEGYAFLASMIFMSNATFLWTEFNARANTALLFFAFAMMTLFNDGIEPLKKRILFIVFMASCLVSHYSTTYTFFFVMLATFVGIEMLSKKYTFKKVVSLTIVILFFAFIFFWYSQVTEAAFDSGVRFIENTFNSLYNFAVIEARSGPAQVLLGKDIMQKNVIYQIHFVLTWITFAFIGIGVVTLLRRYKEMSFPELNFKKPDFLKSKFEVTYFVITLVCSGLLVAIVALPFISKGYGLGRTYPLASTILSVFFVIGGIIFSKHFFFFVKRKPVLKEKPKGMFLVKVFTEKVVGKAFFSKKRFDGENALQNPVRKRVDMGNGSQVRAYLIILLVLIPYFLCITGAMYNIFSVPHSITLNSEGEQYTSMYIHDQESCSAKWLVNNGELKNTKIYTGGGIGGRLASQAGIRQYDTHSLCEEGRKINGYIYLRYYNVVNGKICTLGEEHNMTEYQDKFVGKGKIYTNGGSKIWR